MADNKGNLVKRFQLGAVSSSVFENKAKGKDGQDRTWHTISTDRVFTDKDGKTKNTKSMSVDDELKAGHTRGKAIDLAIELDAKANKGRGSFADRAQQSSGAAQR